MAPLVPSLIQAQDAVRASKTGTITGKAVDSNGNAVGGAIVRVARLGKSGTQGPGGFFPRTKAGHTVWQVTGFTKTAADGTFTISNAPAGKYQILVMDRGVGFGRDRHPVVVTAGASVDAGTITLHQGGPGR
jgi:hypothetical protein